MKLLRSKLSIPEPAQHVVDRSRLVRNILNNKQANLFVLCAPAGFGKTVLALQALKRVRIQDKGWYHLEKEDANPNQFISYFIEALPASFSALKQAGLSVSDKNSSLVCDDICFFFEEYRGPLGWVVLDNWENVNNNREITECVSRLTSHSRGKLNFIITSRVRPRLKTRRLTEQGRAIVLTQGDLCFSLMDFAEVVRTRTNGKLDEAVLEELWKLTGGWCVGVGLLSEVMGHQGNLADSKALLAVKDSEALMGYIEEEILAELPKEFSDFLITCSILDRLSVSDCRAIGYEVEEIDRHLKRLLDSGIPHLRLSDGEAIRLHPLVQAAAKSMLRVRKSPDELRTIYHLAATHSRQQGRTMEAISFLGQIPDYESYIREIDSNRLALRSKYGHKRIRALLDSVPEEFRDSISFIKAKINDLSFAENYADLVEYLGNKFTTVSWPKGHSAMGRLWALYAYAKIKTGRGPFYEKILADWNDFAKLHGPFDETVVRKLENTLSYAAILEAKFGFSIRHAENFLAHCESSSHESLEIGLTNFAYCNSLAGRTGNALNKLKQAEELALKNERFQNMPSILANRANIQTATGHFREALTTVEECRTVMARQKLEIEGVEREIDIDEAMAHWYLGRHKQATELLKNLCTNWRGDTFENRLMAGFAYEFISMLDGCSTGIFDEPEFAGGADGLTNLHMLGLRAARATFSGAFAEAQKLSAELLETATLGEAVPWVVTSNFLLAYAADRTDLPERVDAHLRAGLEQLDNIGWHSYPMACDLITGFVLVKAVKHNILPEVAARLVTGDAMVDLRPAFEYEFNNHRCSDQEAERLLRAAAEYKVNGLAKTLNRLKRKASPKLAYHLDICTNSLRSLPLPPLEIYTLGRFEVLAGGKEVAFSRKQSKLLFQLLLSNYPEQVHEEVILESLWPQGDPEKGKARLYTCISSLRRALNPYHKSGQNNYIECSDNHYRIKFPDETFYDAGRLLEALSDRRWQRGINDTVSENDVEEFYTVLSLYRGDFLPNQPYDRAITEHRNFLRQRHQQIALRFAAISSKGSINSSRAIEVIENARRCDPLWRDGVMSLMSLYVADGQLIKAMRLYRNYENHLQRELDLPPDEELRKYFESLVRPTRGQ